MNEATTIFMYVDFFLDCGAGYGCGRRAATVVQVSLPESLLMAVGSSTGARVEIEVEPVGRTIRRN